MNYLMKYLISFVIIIILLSGCATFQTKREFLPDNIFVCNMPTLRVKLSSDFVYIGAHDTELDAKDEGHDADIGRTTVSTHEYFMWRSKDKSKLIIIQISTLQNPRWSYMGSGFQKKYEKQYKVETLGGDKWNTLIQHNLKFNEVQYKKLFPINSTINKESFYAKSYARMGINSNMMVYIYYLSKTTKNPTPDTDITIIE